MKKTLIYGVLCLALCFSCNDEIDTQETPLSNELNQNRMLSFESMDDLKNTLDQFSTFNSNEDYENWLLQQDFKSLYSSDVVSIEEKDNTPYTFLFILNENKEFRVGDKIITYSDNLFYENSIDESGHTIKENNVIGHFEQELSEVGETELSGNENRLISITNGSEYKPSSAWREFTRQKYLTNNCSGLVYKSLKYRLIHYLAVESVTIGAYTTSNLNFRLRMSYKTSSGWKYNNTSTGRLYDVNLSGFALIRLQNTAIPGTTKYFTLDEQNGCFNAYKGTKTFPIHSYTYLTGIPNLSYYKWDINIAGSVKHQVNGDKIQNIFDTTINW
ncbi:hypothetical protein [uncultured Psychroserpens sp.]|uniref:hypothetical protein n=1 Tax=uncultured Psychroserpens sp. TaxID=255436 RepID=UPI002614D9DC|nr:hypothetical protein [uncultured Psychroserpens sp.]